MVHIQNLQDIVIEYFYHTLLQIYRGKYPECPHAQLSVPGKFVNIFQTLLSSESHFIIALEKCIQVSFNMGLTFHMNIKLPGKADKPSKDV